MGSFDFLYTIRILFYKRKQTKSLLMEDIHKGHVHDA